MIVVQKIYKYGTGHVVPEGAIFLSTIVEERVGEDGETDRFVWHYFLTGVAE